MFQLDDEADDVGEPQLCPAERECVTLDPSSASFSGEIGPPSVGRFLLQFEHPLVISIEQRLAFFAPQPCKHHQNEESQDNDAAKPKH
jgi:hypothetical protein